MCPIRRMLEHGHTIPAQRAPISSPSASRGAKKEMCSFDSLNLWKESLTSARPWMQARYFRQVTRAVTVLVQCDLETAEALGGDQADVEG